MKWQNKGLLFIVFLCWFSPIFGTTLPTIFEKLRVSTDSERVRFVFDANHSIHFQQSELNDPPRIVIDVNNAKALNSFFFPPSSNNPVKRIRTNFLNNHLKIILDLKYALNVKAFALDAAAEKPYRLVIDFSPKEIDLPKETVSFSPKKTDKKIESVRTEEDFNGKRRDIIVVIDPGHGGKDPGAKGPDGTQEKDVVLSISKILEENINQYPGFHAVLTRNHDKYIPLRERLAIARHYKADMFVAIHADAYRDSSAHGASVYALSNRGATGEAARWLARRENESELMGGVNLSDKENILKTVLLNLSQTATIRASLLIGEQMIHSLDQIAHLHHYRVEQAAFVVLKSPDIPSLLVETGFLSNHSEERRLSDPDYQQRVASAIMKGVRSYFTDQPPRDTWLAYWRDHPNKKNAIQ